MSTQAYLDVMAVCLFLIGLMLYLDDLPHRRAGYNHRNCDACEEVNRGRREASRTSEGQDGIR